MKFSILIPCRNETEIIEETITNITNNLMNNYNFEVLLINDFSTDDTFVKFKLIESKYNNIKIFDNKKKGLGGAISLGVEEASGDYIVIYMADMSDDINDLKEYFDTCKNNINIDAVFGSRFIKNSQISNYPKKKLFFNRIFNNFVKIVFLSNYNDFTNAFKIYKKKTLLNLKPIVSENFNVFLELPLKIISRKYYYKIIPIKWDNRKKGKAKFKIKELGSMYVFTLIYCWIEKILLNKKI